MKIESIKRRLFMRSGQASQQPKGIPVDPASVPQYPAHDSEAEHGATIPKAITHDKGKDGKTKVDGKVVPT